MEKMFSTAIGRIQFFSSKEDLAKLLETNGIKVLIGEWALELVEFPCRFKIAYVGNVDTVDTFEVEVDGYDMPNSTVQNWCNEISKILKVNGIKHEITHYDANQNELRTFQ